jgi:hypothetical protein
MEKNMEDLDRIARKRAGAKLGFYIHAAVFVAVNLLLFLVNRQVSPERLWHLWPLGGWAIGLAFHGLAVFFLGSGSRFRERMVERERRHLETERRADRR